jgi:hypothetical protein
MIGVIDTLYTQLGTTGNYSAIADLHTLQFTVTHALGFSAFTSRILVADLSQCHCHFKSHMKSSCQPNSFLAPILQLPIPKTGLNSVPLLPGSCPCRLASRSSTYHFRLDYSTSATPLTAPSLLFKRPSLSLYNPSARTPQKTRSVLLRRRVYWSVT